LPYIEQDDVYNIGAGFPAAGAYDPTTSPPTFHGAKQVIKAFICPSDASLNGNIQRYGFASTNYAANIMVFDPQGPGSIVTSMKDGTSNTVMFAERYKVCGTPAISTNPAWAMHPAYVGHGWDSPVIGWHDYWVANYGGSYAGPFPQPTSMSPLFYDPSFNGGTGQAFQISPAFSACDWRVAQGAHTGSMQICIGDGSVRGVSANMSLTTWTNAGTPSDGFPLGSDW
jgi:hypothetical protein